MIIVSCCISWKFLYRSTMKFTKESSQSRADGWCRRTLLRMGPRMGQLMREAMGLPGGIMSVGIVSSERSLHDGL